jgi:hypothetical protein
MPVHTTASNAAVSQALPEGALCGHQTTAGTARNSAADNWLPVATASGATPVRRCFVKLAEMP